MGRARPTFERLQLGLTLRRLRTRTGLSQEAAAEAIGKTRVRVTQLEDGSGIPSENDMAELLEYYGVKGRERKTVLELWVQARKRVQPRVHLDQLPDAYQRFADLEANASEINWFETGIIPGLLQSPEYMKAVLAEGEGIWWEPSDPEGEERLAFRIERQRRLLEATDQRLLRFVITEDALRANMGKPDVMSEQLHYILTLLRQQRDLTVRVLLNDAYGNPARSHSLLVFSFGDRGTPVGYSTAVPGPAMYYPDESDTSAMLRAFYRVWELALNRKESRRLIASIAEE